MNRKIVVVVGMLLLVSFTGGVFAEPSMQQMLNVFVTNFPKNQNVTVTNFPGTHLGHSTNDLVMLRCLLSGDSPELDCTRVFPDGTATFPFTIPAGSVLVVTDISWTGHSTLDPGQTQDIGIMIESACVCAEVFGSISVVLQDGTYSGSEHMTAGFAVSSSDKLQLISPFSTMIVMSMDGYLTGP